MVRSDFEIIDNYIVITNFDTNNLKLLNDYVNSFDNLKVIFNKVSNLKSEYVIKIELIYKNYLILKQALKIKKEKNLVVELKDIIYNMLKLLFEFDKLNIIQQKTIQFSKLNEIHLLTEFYSYFNKKEYDSFSNKYYDDFPINLSVKYNLLSKKLIIKKTILGEYPTYHLNILNTENYYINDYLYRIFNTNSIFNNFSSIPLKLIMYSISKQCPSKFKKLDKFWNESVNFQ